MRNADVILSPLGSTAAGLTDCRTCKSNLLFTTIPNNKKHVAAAKSKNLFFFFWMYFRVYIFANNNRFFGFPLFPLRKKKTRGFAKKIPK